MFPAKYFYKYNGCKLNVLSPINMKPFNNQILLNNNQIYLGKFIKSKSLLWANDKIITNGIAIFENGSICFADFRNIDICIDKGIVYPSNIDILRKVSFDNKIIYLNDIYNTNDELDYATFDNV